ncbi:MAG: hypothetical protein KAG97_13515, partial [Victivallales bacterium]|nr:hypothetical protein [Victivallales bacterium]
TTDDGNVELTVNFTLGVDPNEAEMELVFLDSTLVSVEDKTNGIFILSGEGNTGFAVSSDGAAVWSVDMPDGSVLAIHDRNEVPIGNAFEVWTDKITNYVTGFDFSALTGVAEGPSRDYLMGNLIMQAVTEFFSEVVDAYVFGLEMQIDSAQQAQIKEYAPFVNMLKASNPMILSGGGIGQIASWIIAQGSEITNCAMKSLLGYFEEVVPEGETIDTKEAIAAASVISDILTGLITPSAVGETETTMFTLKSTAAASGVELFGVGTDISGITSRNMPVMAMIEESLKNHIVLVTSASAGEITYLSSGVPVTETEEVFASKYLGYILSPQDAGVVGGE